MIATEYAKALFEMQVDKSDLSKIRAVLKRRGHEKLLPQIFSEYKKLKLQKERREQAQKITPEQEKTRKLLELYNKLVEPAAK